MDAQRSFNRKVIAFVAVGFAAVTMAAAGSIYVLRENQIYAARVAHTYQVEHRIAEFRVPIERMEALRRGYLLNPGDPYYRDNYQAYRRSIADQIRGLRELVADDPEQVERADEIGKRVALYLIIADETFRKVGIGGQVAAIRDFRSDTSVELLRDIRELATQMAQDEAKLLESRSVAQERSIWTLYGVLAIALILLGFVGVGSILIIVRYTKDLAEGRNALRRLNEGLESAVRERTTDLKRANDEIQRFAYIVSHDLRSPLVNVMGFTSELDAAARSLGGFIDKVEEKAPELADPEAREAVRTDLPEAIGFIRTSTQKMDRLINAILQLSRQGRRVLTPEPLDMKSILEGVADSLRQRADQAQAEIVIDKPLPDVVSDRVGIEQVFSNLIENAVKYSMPGRPNRITVSGKAEPGRVIFEVADQGRGIDPKDHERIFELFRRSGAQDQAGEGIGLAHVRALVYRLGGLISCTSALDQGAVFRVSLPARLLPEQGALS
jgi:signal transduction histidine kinase